MQMYELEPLMANIHKRHKDNWEQARLVAYVVAQSNSSKKLKPADIIQFAWDSEDTATDTSISSDDIKRLREKAGQYTNINN